MSSLSLEKDVAYLKGAIEQLDKRLARVENELSELRREVTQLINQLRSEMKSEITQLRAEINQVKTEIRSEITQLRSEMLIMFRWTIGIVIGTWILVIIPLLLKVLGFI